MMRFELVSERPTGSRRHVVIDGQRHILVDVSTLGNLAWDAAGTIEFPPVAPGWATLRVGPVRHAAWFEGGRTL